MLVWLKYHVADVVLVRGEDAAVAEADGLALQARELRRANPRFAFMAACAAERGVERRALL